MDIFMNKEKKEEKKEEKKKVLGVHESMVKESSVDVSEEVQVSKRGGGRGRSNAARVGQGSKKMSSSSKGEMYRVVISKDSNEALESLFRLCTDDFDTGTITKSDVANYIFQNVSKFFQDSDVKALRAAHFDDKKMLGSILRKEADIPDDLRKAIRAHYGIAGSEKKRSAKQSKSS